ncbi:hypothetical protein, partial [Paracidovorax anthurii]
TFVAAAPISEALNHTPVFNTSTTRSRKNSLLFQPTNLATAAHHPEGITLLSSEAKKYNSSLAHSALKPPKISEPIRN